MRIRAVLVLIALMRVTNRSEAAGGGELPVPAPRPPSRPAAGAPAIAPEASYNEGVQLTARGDWKRAEAAYRRALAAKDPFPEAWNGLGHALKKQRRFPEALGAYQKALAQRPQYAQALEYQGETYVAMGKLGEARETLAKLKPLDPTLATQLERAIASPKISGDW